MDELDFEVCSVERGRVEAMGILTREDLDVMSNELFRFGNSYDSIMYSLEQDHPRLYRVARLIGFKRSQFSIDFQTHILDIQQFYGSLSL